MTSGTLVRGRLAGHPVWRTVLASDTLAGRLIQPLIVSDAALDRDRVEGAGGLARISITEAVREARAAAASGIAGLLVFGASERKDEDALIAVQRDHIVPRAVRAIKDALPDLAVITDVCVCAYTSHGQCVLFAEGGAHIAHTHERLAEIALVHVEAGADMVLPSGMLDGSVGALRAALADHPDVPIAAMAKLGSTLYQLNRIAVGAVPIDERAVPLLDPADRGAADARVRRDVAAGADAVVVKPGVSTLDLVAALASSAGVPVIAYHTADEHAIFAAESDADGPAAEHEAIAASRRAGADIVITYGALSFESI